MRRLLVCLAMFLCAAGPSTRPATRPGNEQLIDPPVFLGNEIAATTRQDQGEWMSVRQWYIIGPFPGRGDKQRAPAHPPEQQLDLDAVYDGLGGRKVKWKYRALDETAPNKGQRVEPYAVDVGPNAVYYFYAQVQSDADRTVLACFAADDYGACWVNGAKVYESPNEPQPWLQFSRLGFAPIKLKKGLNQLLFKLENARGTTGMGVVMMTYEDKGLLQAIKEGQ